MSIICSEELSNRLPAYAMWYGVPEHQEYAERARDTCSVDIRLKFDPFGKAWKSMSYQK